jgi:hypothetical protein
MATPTWVAFTSTSSADAVLNASEPLRERERFQPYQMFRIVQRPDGSREMDHHSRRKIVSEDEALTIARNWDGFAISYHVGSVRADVHFCCWKEAGGNGLALETDTQIPYHRSDDYAEGEWLEQLLCEFTPLTKATISAYGHPYQVSYTSLDPAAVLRQLRDGSMLLLKGEVFHMISTALVSVDEMRQLFEGHQRNSRLKYTLTTTGYHVLSTVGPRRQSIVSSAG